MQVLIDRRRLTNRLSAGWFARRDQPAYQVWLDITFSEEEQFLIIHTGIGAYIFFQAPIPPHITSEREIAKLRTQNFGFVFVRDLLRFNKPTLIGTWPDLTAADTAETAIRAKLEELSDQLLRGGEPTETTKVFEP